MSCVDFVNGKTKVLGVIGHPIAHTFSPVIHNTLGKILDHNIIYTAYPVEPSRLEGAIKGAHCLQIQGINVTVPHKQEVMAYLEDIDPLARQVGAVNTLKRTETGYVGYNTDVEGLLRCLQNRQVQLKGRRVLLLGAGGAARAAAVMAASQAPKKIWIANRTMENARKLGEDIKAFYGANIEAISWEQIEDLEGIDLCIQTTPIGMSPHTGGSPIGEQVLKNVKVALDLIYNPWKTKFLADAEKAGCQIINGFDMLYYQAVKAYEIWGELKIDAQAQRHVKDILEQYYMQSGRA